MDLIGDDLDGATVLDLFAGTGALALEALSRGAERADLVERNPSAMHALKANVAALRAGKQARIFKKDALAFLPGIRPPGYDIAFVDPPYTSSLAKRIVEAWRADAFARILVVETASGTDLPRGGKRTVMGDTTVTVYRARSRPRRDSR